MRRRRESRLATNCVVHFNCISFIPHYSSSVFIPAIGQPVWVGGKFAEHFHQLNGMQGGQSGFCGRRAALIVKLGKKLKGVLCDTNNAVAVTRRAPFAIIILDSRDQATSAMFKRGVDGGHRKKIRNVGKCDGIL